MVLTSRETIQKRIKEKRWAKPVRRNRPPQAYIDARKRIRAANIASPPLGKPTDQTSIVIMRGNMRIKIARAKNGKLPFNVCKFRRAFLYQSGRISV